MRISKKEITKIIIISVLSFLILGAVTAVYENSFFQRMTALYWFDYVLLILESLLIGVFLGVNAPDCAIKKAGVGGILGFLGFACPICNKLLLLLFGSGLLLTYFEPIRPLVGALGIILLGLAVYKKLSLKLLTQTI